MAMKTFFYTLLFLCVGFSSVRAEKVADVGGYFGDSVLYVLSMQMFDSIRTDAFFDMQRRGLAEAERKGSRHFEYVFRTAAAERFYLMGDKQRYMDEMNSLLEHYRQHADTANLYNIWYTLVDRMQQFGDYAEALETTRDMGDYARSEGHALGVATADYCLARCYQNNHQPNEADRYYHKAMPALIRVKAYNHAVSCGFNLVNTYLAENRVEEALAMNDSVAPLISSWEQSKGISVNPVARLKLALRYMDIYGRMDNREKATAWRDSTLSYNRIYADPAQQEGLQYSLAVYEKQFGSPAEAERILSMLVDYREKSRNYPFLADYLRQLAALYHSQGRLKEAADCYHRYIEVSDTARILQTDEQLNRLARVYRLRELKQEKELATARQEKARLMAVGIGVAACVLLLACVLLALYLRILRRKNEALCATIREYARQQTKPQSPQPVAPEGGEKAETAATARNRELFNRLAELMRTQRMYADPQLTRDALVKELGVSKNRLYEALMQEAHCSLQDYITECRLKEAVVLMEQTPDMPLSEVGERVGYSSYTTFYRSFVNRFRISPTDYRRFLATRLLDVGEADSSEEGEA